MARVRISPHATADDVDAVVAMVERSLAETKRASVSKMLADDVDPDDIEAYEDAFDAQVARWRLDGRAVVRDLIRDVAAREAKQQ